MNANKIQMIGTANAAKTSCRSMLLSLKEKGYHVNQFGHRGHQQYRKYFIGVGNITSRRRERATGDTCGGVVVVVVVVVVGCVWGGIN